MYPAAVLTLLLIVLVACLAEWVEPPRRVLGRLGFAFSTIGAAVQLVDYAIQLTVLQPALVRGQTDGMSPWNQYNPFGVFIGLENVGYAVLNLGFSLWARPFLDCRPDWNAPSGWSSSWAAASPGLPWCSTPSSIGPSLTTGWR